MSDTMSYKLDPVGSKFRLIGAIDGIKNIDKNKAFSIGDIIYDKANQGAYLYTDEGKFEPLFTDKDTDSSAVKMKPHPTNCENCGAVLRDYKCEYCGTEYPRY